MGHKLLFDASRFNCIIQRDIQLSKAFREAFMFTRAPHYCRHFHEVYRTELSYEFNRAGYNQKLATTFRRRSSPH